MKKKTNIPSFNPTPNDSPLVAMEQNVTQKSSSDMSETEMEETVAVVYNKTTKTYDKVFLKFSLNGKIKIVKIEKGHTNPLVIQQELSKYFLDKLVLKKK